jgi:Uma2 family endonuclease
METPKKVWTYEDLEQLPDDSTRYEIIDGELFVVHQSVLGRLHVAFQAQLDVPKLANVFLAPLDVIMSRTRVVQPDLVVISAERRGIIKRRIEGVPDLLVEILSESNTKHDRVTKRRLYARCGVREYWMVDTDAQTVEVLELVEGGLSYRQHGWYGPGDRARAAMFPVEVAVDELFREE